MTTTIETIAMTEVPVEADELKALFGLATDHQTEDVLTAAAFGSYGDFSPDEEDASLRGVFRTELLQGLRSMTSSARAFLALANNAFPYAAHLACADYGGSEAIPKLMGAISMFADVRERDEPIRANDVLTFVIVSLFYSEWLRIGGARDVDAFESFVRLALRGRRDLPEPTLTGTILSLTASWRAAPGGRPLHPFRYPSEDWAFVTSYSYMGGVVHGELGELPKRAYKLADEWAQSGVVLVATYEDTSLGGYLTILANGSETSAPSEQVAFREADGVWEECDVPENLARLIAWARLHRREH